MILSFGQEAAEDIFHGANTKEARSVPVMLWPAVRRKLDMLNAAHDLRDVMAPPGNRLEILRGKWKGRHSIRVNDQYRIVFVFQEGNVSDVRVVDYH